MQSHAGQRLDRFLAMRLPSLSRTRVQALIKERPRELRRRDHRGRHISGQTGRPLRARASAAGPAPRSGRRRSRSTSSTRTTRSSSSTSRPASSCIPAPATCDRHSRQCADRPLRREPLGHRRRGAARHRASPRQGHERADGRRQDRSGASRARRSSSPTTAAPARSSAAISRLSGARRRDRTAPSTRRSAATRRAAPRWRSCPAQGTRGCDPLARARDLRTRRGTRSRSPRCSNARWRPDAPIRCACISPISALR